MNLVDAFRTSPSKRVKRKSWKTVHLYVDQDGFIQFQAQSLTHGFGLMAHDLNQDDWIPIEAIPFPIEESPFEMIH